ncbi:MAG TPA: 4-alpha-glucanotransferase [Polyangiales bacterium]|nr:4-alpha-glucanotransferase [Polyangiales bacterium]
MMRIVADPNTAQFRASLAKLGVERFVLGIHASSFPAGAWDTGYGAPCSNEGERVLRFAAQLGFNALQLGPAGAISPINLSPYDGTVFARNAWALGVETLTRDFGALLREEDAALLLRAAEPRSVNAGAAQQNLQRVLARCYQRFVERRQAAPNDPIFRAFAEFRASSEEWLALDAVYAAVAERAGDDPSAFEPGLRAIFEPGAAGEGRRSALRATLGADIERVELTQFLLHAQHEAFCDRAERQGIQIWGDMQVGYSHRDRFLRADAFSPQFLLGAPPSRTNPAGQAWGYPMLDPDQLARPDSPARRLFLARARKLLAEHAGVRVDHPHGLVCPWVYSAAHPDSAQAVRDGTRARESPDLQDPTLARWAIVRESDLNPHAEHRYADDWVSTLDAAQEAQYAALFDVLIELCHEAGLATHSIAAEVLSTCPYPLWRVLQRHGLGRFRVTQKVNLLDESDVYRTDKAQPNDWLMLGTHDTPPVFALTERWLSDGSAPLRAAYLAERLIADPNERQRARELFASSTRALLTASLADLFSSGARNVYVFVGDLFGETVPFNRAGIVHADNWTYRLDPDFERVYAERVQRGAALDVTAALDLAIRRSLI